MAERSLSSLADELEAGLEGLFVVTHRSIHQWENGEYFCIYGRPSRRLRTILDVEREVVFVGNTYYDQQQRTISFAQKQIRESRGRLEPRVLFIVHSDSMGNSKLKKWGREAGLTIIPIYVGNEALPKGRNLERLLSFEFFSQDPFDVTGPVASDSQFFGRRTEAQELARKLQLGQIRSIFGIRKIGKTSIMHRVVREIGRSEALMVFVDCSQDGIFQLRAAGLMTSIAATIDDALHEGLSSIDLKIADKNLSPMEASKCLIEAVEAVSRPLILAFDEVDYITPASPTASHWKNDFIEFWRNVRAIYQSSIRNNKKFSILVSGVSSKWFSVESIDNVENAALSFVPEEYLSPLPRGAAVAMIKTMGPTAGINFDESASDYISSACSDMPFWIRKACSFIHSRLDSAKRPVTLTRKDVRPLVSEFIRDEGAAMSKVALQHLFRVYPETREAALNVAKGGASSLNPSIARVLTKYGIVSSSNAISGEMLEAGLQLIRDLDSVEEPILQGQDSQENWKLALELGDWAEELQAIAYRRNLVERRVRELVVNFVKFSSLSVSGSKPPKQRIFDCLPQKRRDELANLSLEQIGPKLYWLELAAILKKEWQLFERVFGDLARLEASVDVINDRPDAHAKNIDMADVALYRRALTWFEERLEKVG